MNNSLLALLMLLPLTALAGSETDLAYGREAEHRLDVYYPDRCLAARGPVVTWVHRGGWRESVSGVMPIDTASYDLVANNGAAAGRMIEDADSHLARELMRFVGLQQRMGPF